MVEAERERRRQVLRVIIKQDRQKKLLEERKKQVEPGTGWDVAHVSKGQLSVVKTSYEMEQYGSDSLEPQEKGLDRLRPHLMFVSVILSYSVMTYGVITQTEILVFGPLLVWAVGLFIYKLGVRAFTRFVAYPALLALGIAFFLFGTSPLWSLYLATVLTIALPIYFGPIWPFS